MRAFQKPLMRGASLLVLAVTPLLTGCAAGQMSNMWRDESFKAAAMHNVLVVALRTDQVRRRLWEDSFVNGLAVRGTKATASYKLWALAAPDTQQVIEAIRRDAYDGIVVSMRLPDGAEQTFVPGYTRREAVTERSPFTGAYYTVWQEVEIPARAETLAVANFQTDVWATGPNGRLVWSGSSRTTNNVDADVIKANVEKLILPEMSKAGIVPQKLRK